MDFERLIEMRNTGFAKEIGLRITQIREGYAKGELVLRPMHGNPIGSVHGGLIFTIADTVGGTAATSRGRFVTTVSGNMNYLRPAMNCEKLIGESVEIKIGKNMCVYDVVITNETGKEIAKATMTYYYLQNMPPVETSMPDCQ
ncbi:MAG: PaaI family thioesterase [Lachnospiraceae bacterium]|nr:PaaI family thioesterase [Lachnospiraceae bacterium]